MVPYTRHHGIHTNYITAVTLEEDLSYAYFSTFLDKEILDETNLYATQVSSKTDIPQSPVFINGIQLTEMKC